MGNNEISIAQTRFNATGTSVQEIGTGQEGVPNAKDVTNAVTATAGAGGGGRIAGTATLGLGGPTGSSSAGGRLAASLGLMGVVGVVALVV